MSETVALPCHRCSCCCKRQLAIEEIVKNQREPVWAIGAATTTKTTTKCSRLVAGCRGVFSDDVWHDDVSSDSDAAERSSRHS